MSKSSPPPAPNYAPLIAASQQAAAQQNATSQAQLQWAREQYAQDRQLVDPIVQKQMAIQDQNQQQAQEDRARYKSTYQPLEDQLVKDAQSYASPERKQFEMGRAQSDTAQAMDQARINAQTDLEAFGVNPSATKFAALDTGAQAQKGAAMAAAGQQAALATEATGRAMRDQAINIGRGYVGQSQAEYGTSLGAGSGAANTNLAATASGANTMGTAPTWGALGNNSITGAGNILHSQGQDQLASWKAKQDASSGWGSVAGAGHGALTSSGFSSSALGMGLAMLSEGGAVPEMPAAPGQALPVGGQTPPGQVPAMASPTGGRAIDDVPARLTAGEFVLPRDVTSWYGEEKLQKMIQQARQAKAGAGARPRMAALPVSGRAQSPAALPLR